MKVKVCGITNFEDAKLAIDLGAYALGFVFYEKSPRYITPSEAKKIIDKLPKGIKTVGVFVNEAKEQLEEVQKVAGFSVFQLHGNETAELCSSLELPVIKAFSESFSNYEGVDAYLIDAKVKGQWGGTGKLSDWSLAKRAKAFGDVILSGGLNADNIARAIKEVEPYGVDVSSGVELSAGVKNHDKLRKFFKKINELSL